MLQLNILPRGASLDLYSVDTLFKKEKLASLPFPSNSLPGLYLACEV